MTNPNKPRDAGKERATEADAVAAAAPSAWRPLLIRAALGIGALLGLSGIGAVSMLAGIEGAHASPPVVADAAMASASAVSAGVSLPASNTANAPTSSAEPAPQTAETGSVPAICKGVTDDGRVVLNLAGLEELRRIPGIGAKRAEAILQLRAKLKRFKRGADLLRVRGIGPKSLARMQSHFVIDPPPGWNCSEVPPRGAT
jgi:competence protein ComEA